VPEGGERPRRRSAQVPAKQSEQADDNELNGDDIVKQPRNDKNKDAGNQRD
jgi:hypothetical protein